MFDQIFTAFLNVSVLEWSAIFATVLCVFLAGRNSVHSWWIGIIGTILYAMLFYQFNLFADVLLQMFFVLTGFIGWYSWANPDWKVSFIEPSEKISKATAKSSLIMFIGAVCVAICYGVLLKTFTTAYAPFVDSLVLTFSVVAQLLLMRRKLENWPFWILVNTVAVPLYWSRELYPTAIMYSAFWVHAWWAWHKWKIIIKEQNNEPV
jgi:nicotinamide mononucleotide transporter